MAGSNWDTLAIDLDGNPINGTFTDPAGLTVVIYKNWLYLRHAELWQIHDGGFTEPTIAEMTEGKLRFGPTAIYAKRGRTKESVLAAVVHTEYQQQIGGLGSSPIVTGMIGIGCYGYDGYDWVGIEQAEIDELRWWLDDLVGEHMELRSVPSFEKINRWT